MAVGLFAVTANANLASSKRSLSIADGIASTRAMVNGENEAVFPSPDGTRYAAMLVSGDLLNDGVSAEILVGRLVPGIGAKPRSITKFFTRGLGPTTGFAMYGSTILTSPQENVPVWLNNRQIALLWENNEGVIQVVVVDAETGEKTFMTNSSTDVTAFTIHPNGQVIYDALTKHSRSISRELMHDGFAVNSPQALPLLAGYVDGISMFDFMNTDRYLSDRSRNRMVKVEMASPFHYGFGSLIQTDTESSTGVFSPDGSKLVLNTFVDEIPKSWLAYQDATLKRSIEAHAQDPTGLAARLVQQLVVVDSSTGKTQQLWNAPVDASDPIRFVWSPDGSSILIWPTFVPISSTEDTNANFKAIADVEVDTGRFHVIPVQRPVLRDVDAIQFESKDEILIELRDGRSIAFRRVAVGWSEVSIKSKFFKSAGERPAKSKMSAQVKLRQTLNSPPDLVVDSEGHKITRLMELNPQFDQIAFGQVEIVRWIDEANRDWKGRLYYPVDYKSTVRYPVVIQTRCRAEEAHFSIYGCGDNYPTAGPGWSSFIAQSLAGEGFAVLQVAGPNKGIDGADMAYEWEAQTVLEAGWRSAAEYLVEAGIARRERIGLMGFSLTGWVVEYVLAHSTFPFAAAIASDHGNMGYMQASLYGWPAGPANAAGSQPFGDGLELWRKHAPVFNVERIRAPLQLQLTSSGENLTSLLWHWEMFSRLRHLKKPVEYYVIPDVHQGSHTLQNPKQLLALQTRALDWWCFWLKDEEHEASEKREQYAAWRELRALQQSGRNAH